MRPRSHEGGSSDETMTQPDPATGVPTCYRHPGRESHIRCQRCERPICPDCMHNAAVGFQCPECVAEGRRTQRTPRTSYGGLVPSGTGVVSLTLIGINVVVWLLVNLTGGSGSRLLDFLALRATGRCGADGGGYFPNAPEGLCAAVGGHWVPGVSDGAVWQLLTATFTQVGLPHLFFNCLSIYFLGPQLEAVLGRARFIALYLLSGLAGSALVYWSSGGDTIGASGAVFGLMAALLLIVVRGRGQAQGVLLWVGLSFLLSFRAGISWQGHLGGFLGGLAVTAVLVFAPRSSHTVRSRFQVAGLTVIGVAIAVAVVARSVALA